jgi:hypothetical protein
MSPGGAPSARAVPMTRPSAGRPDPVATIHIANSVERTPSRARSRQPASRRSSEHRACACGPPYRDTPLQLHQSTTPRDSHTQLINMVLPVRIELTTSPFLPLRLSPPRRRVRGLDCPFTIGRNPQVPPVQSLHLPRRAWLGITISGFPDFERFSDQRFRWKRQTYQGGALPLSYGSFVVHMHTFSNGFAS